uniref:Uncharacterized protein n=1 Tax=Plectus sambesii TaxID=2011161 RepID=A0A914UKP7_9BILA
MTDRRVFFLDADRRLTAFFLLQASQVQRSPQTLPLQATTGYSELNNGGSSVDSSISAQGHPLGMAGGPPSAAGGPQVPAPLAVSSPSGSSGGQRHDLTPLSGDTPSQIGSQNPLQTSVDSISEAAAVDGPFQRVVNVTDGPSVWRRRVGLSVRRATVAVGRAGVDNLPVCGRSRSLSTPASAPATFLSALRQPDRLSRPSKGGYGSAGAPQRRADYASPSSLLVGWSRGRGESAYFGSNSIVIRHAKGETDALASRALVIISEPRRARSVSPWTRAVIAHWPPIRHRLSLSPPADKAAVRFLQNRLPYPASCGRGREGGGRAMEGSWKAANGARSSTAQLA